MHEKRMKRLAKELNLTDAQKTKISGLLDESWKEIQKETQAFREKVKQIRENSDAKILAELDKDQAAKWKELKTKMRKKAREKMKERRESKKHGDKDNLEQHGENDDDLCPPPSPEDEDNDNE